MTCPKCGGSMATRDRLGVHVDQCQSCKGIFLDYGELEQIVNAEEQFNSTPPPMEYGAPPASAAPAAPAAPPPAAPAAPAAPAGPGYGYRPDSPSPYRGRPDSPGPFGGGFGGGYRDSPRPYGKKRRKKSIFDQLFD